MSTDKEVLQFIYDRLLWTHRENSNYDYMHRFKEIIDKWNPSQLEQSPPSAPTTSEPKPPGSGSLTLTIDGSSAQLEDISLVLRTVLKNWGVSYDLRVSVGSEHVNYFSRASTPTSAADAVSKLPAHADPFQHQRS